MSTEQLHHPRALTCAHCAEVVDRWFYDPDQVAIDERDGHVLGLPGWDWDGSWWADPQDMTNPWSFCCSQGCFDRRRSKDAQGGHDTP